MKKTLLCLALIYLSTSNVHTNANHPCGDNTWSTYKDEKCFQLFKSLETRDSAEDICKQQYSKLVTIKSADEQTFLIEYVFNSSKSNDVWIGAKRRLDSSTEFDWNDGSPVEHFTNWAIGRPSDVVSRTCVLMQSLLARNLYQMEWTDVACNNGYWYICEKLQSWSFEQLQQAILSNRRELQRSVDSFTNLTAAQANHLHNLTNLVDDLKNDLTAQATQLQVLKNDSNTQASQLQVLRANPVPIGFIYVQLPGQPDPQNLWGTVGWTEITSQYAGLFFRAEGENSAAFGSVQAENSPRLTRVATTWIPQPGVAVVNVNADGLVSAAVTSGSADHLSIHWGLSFRVSSGEVRPRNQAMRIWKRNQ